MKTIDKNVILNALGHQLVGGSLTDTAVMRATEATADFAILPWVNVVKIGGQSIMDRGRSAVYPLVDEIVAHMKHHKMILRTRARTPARPIHRPALHLGFPTARLPVLGTPVAP